MSQLQLFARLAKVDEAKRQVTGIIASETPDAANEIFDYETSKGNFEAWSANVAKMSGGKSVGNLRAMHGNVAAGTLEEITFDDVAKTITVVANVVDDNEWTKCLKGVYTGFSIGGKYVKKWADTIVKSAKRYTAAPSEVSLVDIGCNFDAGFSLVKADGMEERVEFHVPDTSELMEKLATPDLPQHIRADYIQQLAKAHGINVVVPVVGEPDEEEELAKGAYTIGQLARLADDVRCFASYDSFAYNMDGTQTPKSFAPEVKAAALALYDALLKLVSDDVAEAKTKIKELKKQADDEEGEVLAKRADEVVLLNTALDSLCKALGAEHNAESPRDVVALAKINELVSGTEELQKSLGQKQTELDTANAEIQKLKDQPAATKGALRHVVGKEEDGLNKSADSGAGGDDGEKDPLVLMKRAQSNPISIGVPTRFNQNGG